LQASGIVLAPDVRESSKLDGPFIPFSISSNAQKCNHD